MILYRFFIIFVLLIIISTLGISSEEIVRKVIDTYNKLDTFYSILEVYNRSYDKEESSIYELYYQKPDTYKLEMIEGKDKGEVLILKGGIVRGHKGGILKYIVLTVDPNDPSVLNIRKMKINELGLEYVIEQIVQAPVKIVKEDRIAGYNCYVLEMGLSKDRIYTYVSQVFYIDKNTFIPVQLEQYENYNNIKTLVHKRIYKNYKININFDPNIFKI